MGILILSLSQSIHVFYAVTIHNVLPSAVNSLLQFRVVYETVFMSFNAMNFTACQVQVR